MGNREDGYEVNPLCIHMKEVVFAASSKSERVSLFRFLPQNMIPMSATVMVQGR